MADVTMKIRFEMDFCLDAVRRIAEMHCALARRHGPEFRALEQRIERLADTAADMETHVIMHQLNNGTIVPEPPEEFKLVIAEGERLGL